MLTVLIKNGKVIDPKNNISDKMDVLLEGRKISKIEKNIQVEANYVIDATGCIVAPGFVDLHTNFCDPGVTSREDLKSGSLAAVKGGYTWVVLGSENRPSTSEANVIDYITRFRGIMPINMYPTAAVTIDRAGEEISDMQFLKNHQVIGFSDGLKPIENKFLLRRIMNKTKELGMPLTLFCEKTKKTKIRGISAGKIATDLKIKGASDPATEVEDLQDNLDMVKEVGCILDIAYISTKESVNVAREAKKDMKNVYFEVNPYNVCWTEKLFTVKRKKDLIKETYSKMLPPLRTEIDRKALIEGLKDGTIDIISSNHLPITEEEKEEKLKDALPGAISIEFVLGMLGSKLVDTEILTWDNIIEKIAVNPAKVYGLDQYGAGSLEIGQYANITIFNPNEEWVVDKEKIVSKSRNCPIYGQTMKGRIKKTICNGRLVFDDDAVEEKKVGLDDEVDPNEKIDRRVKVKNV